MIGDGRSRRIAVVPDALVNSEADRARMDALVAEGWGLIQLPAGDLDPAVRAELVELIAEQVDEYQRHGYVVAAHAPDAQSQQDVAAIAEACREALPPLP